MGRTRRLRRLQLTRALLKYHTHTRRSLPFPRFVSLRLSFVTTHHNRSLARHDPTRARRHRRARALGDSVADSRRRSRSSSRARRPRVVVPGDSRRDVLTAGTTNARDGRVVEGLRCVVCRAVGPSSFAASDSGFYVCVRCGTQTQSQVEDAAEMGLEEAEGGDVFGGGGQTARGLRRRVGGSRREGRVRRGASGETRADGDAGWTSSGGGVRSAFQAVLERSARGWFDGASSRGERTVRTRVRARAFGVGLEVTVREVWARYARESGVLDVAEDGRRGRGGDAGEEKTSTEKTSLAREMTKRLPMVMSLGIVYVACARRREAVLPVDLSRMAAEGTLPYLTRTKSSRKSAVEAWWSYFRETIFFNRTIGRDGYHARTHRCGGGVRRGEDSRATSADQRVGALTRFVGEFNLDARVVDVARRVLSLYLSPALRYGSKHDVGTPESTLFAYLVVTLKFLYGLDGGRRRQSAA